MIIYSEPASQFCLGEILLQTTNSIYQVYTSYGKKELGIGFFCYIQLETQKIPVVIINNCEFNKEDIDNIIIIIKGDEKKIKLGNIRIKNKEFNVTVFEVEENKKNGIHFLELDDRLYKKEYECYFNNDSLYVIHCSNINNILISSGRISDIYNSKAFKYFGYNNEKGSIIFNLSNNKIIGINGEKKSNFKNIGFFFKPIIEGFKIKYKHLISNEINMVVKIEKDDINKTIYFLGNNEDVNNLKWINELNTEVYINDKKIKEFKKYFKPGKEGEYKIKIKINNIITDCSYMFAG